MEEIEGSYVNFKVCVCVCARVLCVHMCVQMCLTDVQKREEDVRWPALSLSLEKGSPTQPELSLKASESQRTSWL